MEQGDGAGFDVRSYETDGTDRFIEVKTTAYGIYTPLYLSRNELRVSEASLVRPMRFSERAACRGLRAFAARRPEA